MRLQIAESSNNMYDFSLSHNKNDYDHVATVKSDAWAAEYVKHTAYIPTGLMPPAIRYLSSDHRVIVWERPPAYQAVNYSPTSQENLNVDAGSLMTFRLPVPWQTYVMYLSPEGRLANVFVFFHKGQRFDMREHLHFAPLPNLYGSGRLCQAVYSTLQEHERSVAGAANAAYNMVWNSGFNNDTLLAFNILAGSPLRTNPLAGLTSNPLELFKKWVSYPLPAVVAWDWPESPTSLTQFIQNRHYLENLDDQIGTHELLVNMTFAAQDAETKN